MQKHRHMEEQVQDYTWPQVTRTVCTVLLLFCAITGFYQFAVVRNSAFVSDGLFNEFLNIAQFESRRVQLPKNGEVFSDNDIVGLSHNPYWACQLLPDRHGTLTGVPYHANSQGMRGPEVLVAKRDGVWRIAAVGDSTMFGWRAPEELIYVRVLERALNSIPDKVQYEVLNFSAPAYNMSMKAEVLLARAKAFSPDVVLLQYDMDDLTLPFFIVSNLDSLLLTRNPMFAFLKHSFLLGPYLQRQFPAAFNCKAQKVKTPTGEWVSFGKSPEEVPVPYRYMVGKEGIEQALLKVWNGIDLPILHLSNPYPMNTQHYLSAEEYNFFEEFIREQASLSGGFYLDISHASESFAKDNKIDSFRDLSVEYPVDLHPTVERHILIARMIYLSLVENRMLPADSNHYQRHKQVEKQLWNMAQQSWDSRKTPATFRGKI